MDIEYFKHKYYVCAECNQLVKRGEYCSCSHGWEVRERDIWKKDYREALDTLEV